MYRPLNYAALYCAVTAAALAVGLAWNVLADDPEYVGHQQCRVCHNKPDEGAQWSKWRDMKHAQAYELLKTDEAKAVAAELGLTTPPVESPECLRCHVTAYDVETKSAPAAIKLEDGVQCESCHGPSSEHIPIGRILMFQPDRADEVDVSAGRLMPGRETCVQCHNEENPTWRDDRYELEDGTTVGFDFDQAWEKIEHLNPKKHQDEE